MKLIVYLLILIFAGGCSKINNDESIMQLPSGKRVSVVNIVKTKYGNGDLVIELNYRTDLSIQGTKALKDEVDEVWVKFKPYAEKQGFDLAIIRAHEKAAGLFIKQSRSESFLFKKNGGDWVTIGQQKV